jgi:WD40 repeat protein
MSRESRDGNQPYESDDARSNHSADENDQNDEQPQDESPDSERVHRHDGEHQKDHKGHLDAESRGEHERHAHSVASNGRERSLSDDAEAETSHRRASDRPAAGLPHSQQGHDRPHARAHDRSDDRTDGPMSDHAADPTKFASYDDEEASSHDGDDDCSQAPRAERTYRAEPAHRPPSDYRAGAPRETAAGQVPAAQPTAAPRRATGPAPYSAADPTAPADESPAYGGSRLHPYDHQRASLIGLSTALVAAIAAIVFLMYNLSKHQDIAQSAVKDRDQFATRLTAAERNVQDAQALAAQHASNAKSALAQAEQNRQLAQNQSKAYLAAQEQLSRSENAQRQTQAESQYRLYVTKIRLAKQAWDRGDTNEVLQLLDPYRSDPVLQKFRSFAWYYLWRAAHNGGSSTLRGHGDIVRQAVVTPDGSQIVTFADDGQLIVWDAALGRKLNSVALERNVPPHSPGLNVEDALARQASGLVVASDGKWAAAYGRKLYVGSNIGKPDVVRPVTDHQAPIISLAMSSDGKRLVSGDYSGEIMVRDATDGSVLRRFHNPRPQALALSNNGGVLFAGMHDGNVFVWDANKGDLFGTRAFGDGINSMALSPDGSTVALALAVRDGVVRLWEPATGKNRDLRGHHDEVLRVVWSDDGKSLLTASRDKTACLWSSSGGLLRTFRGHLGDVETVAFSPNGQKVVSAGDDQSAILWNVDGGQPCDMLTDTPVDGWVSGLAFTPDSTQLIGTGSCDGAGDSFEAYLTAWNLADAEKPAPLQTSSRSGVALAFSPDGRQMAVGESSPPESTVKSRVRIWSLDAGAPGTPGRVLATVPKLVGSVYSVAYSNDGRLLAVGTGDVDERLPGSVLVLEPGTGALRQKLPDMPGKVEAVFSVDSRFLITVNSSKKHAAEVRMWNPLTAEPAGQISNPAELAGLTTIALSPDGRYLVTGHGDPVNPAAADKVKIKIWDLSTQKLVGTLPVAGAPGGYPIAGAGPAAITRLEFTRRGTLLASGDMAGNVRLWDFASRKLFAKQIAPQGRPIIYLAFNPAGTRLAVATDKADKNGLRCVRICNVDTGEELRDVEVALGVPNVVRFNQDGKLMAAATSAGGLFLWDAVTFNPRAILHGEGNAAGQLGHGGVITCVAPLLSDKLLTGSVDKTVRIWDLKTRTAAAKAFNFNQAVSCMAVSPDGRWLAVGTGKYRSKFEAGELVICDLTNQQAPRSISQGITPVSLAYSPDGNALAVCSLSAAVVQAAHTVNIIDLRSGRATFINSPMGQSVAFSPDGLTLAVGCADGEIDLWPLDSAPSSGAMKPCVVKKHTGLVWSLAFSPDSKTLASGSADNNVVIWDVPTGEDLMTLKHNGGVEALRFSRDGQLLATAAHEPSRGSVCLWHAPPDEDAPLNSLRAGGPTTFDRPANLDAVTTMRSAYPEPTGTPAGTPAGPPAAWPGQGNRRGAGPAAPSGPGFAPPENGRYNTAPSPPSWPTSQPLDGAPGAPGRGGADSAVPLPIGPSFDSGAPSTDGLIPPGGFSQPSGSQDNPSGGRPNNGRRTRPGS